MSGCIRPFACSHSPVFLVNSCLDHFSAPRPSGEDPLSRSYGVSLPSSLTANHPSALVCSTRPRVSVYGTDGPAIMAVSGFSRRRDYPRYRRAPGGLAYCQVRIGACASPRPSAPTPFNRQFRLPAAVSLPRPRIPRTDRLRNIDRISIGCAQRLRLRIRLTPGRLTSPGNPWSYGGGASNPPYRYLCLHLRFHRLHPRLTPGIQRRWNAPLPDVAQTTPPRLRRAPSYPIIIHAGTLD